MLCALTASVSYANQGGDNGGGNGGDTVFCVDSQKNAFKGYYSLDYFITYQKKTNNADIVPVNSWEESRSRILKHLKFHAPKLAESFETFLRGADLLEPSSQPGIIESVRLWVEAPFGLIDIKDERLVRSVPANCLNQAASGSQFVQAIIRHRTKGLITYEYDYQVLEKLKAEAPLQFSYLIVHEWLWDVLKDVRAIRNVNRLLHSVTLENSSTSALQAILSGFGVNVPDPYLPYDAPWVCEATYAKIKGPDGYAPLKGAIKNINGSGESAQEAFDNMMHNVQGLCTPAPNYVTYRCLEIVVCREWAFETSNAYYAGHGKPVCVRAPTLETDCRRRYE